MEGRSQNKVNKHVTESLQKTPKLLKAENQSNPVTIILGVLLANCPCYSQLNFIFPHEKWPLEICDAVQFRSRLQVERSASV